MGAITPFINAPNARVLIMGDVHGNRAQAIKDVAYALNKRARVLVYAGDFGVGFRLAEDADGNTYDPWSEFISDLAVSADIDIAFVDGNHENFDYLDTFGQHDAPYEVAKNVWHLPRGAVFSIAGTTFATMGGAISVDRQWRTPGTSWWAQEAISLIDMERFYNNVDSNIVDVLITHDGPWTPIAHRHDYHTGGDYPDREIIASVGNRDYITELTRDFAPKVHAHGHMHLAYEYEFAANTTVYGLGRDEGTMADRSILLDVVGGEVKILKEEDRTNLADKDPVSFRNRD